LAEILVVEIDVTRAFVGGGIFLLGAADVTCAPMACAYSLVIAHYSRQISQLDTIWARILYLFFRRALIIIFFPPLFFFRTAPKMMRNWREMENDFPGSLTF
jgi:hypothetical protein